jgi:hypothetical protein
MHQRAVLAGMLLGDAGLDPQAFRRCSLLASADIGENPASYKSPCRDVSPNRKLLKHDYILSVGTLGPWVGLGFAHRVVPPLQQTGRPRSTYAYHSYVLPGPAGSRRIYERCSPPFIFRSI